MQKLSYSEMKKVKGGYTCPYGWQAGSCNLAGTPFACVTCPANYNYSGATTWGITTGGGSNYKP
jgi:hypothetical protein